MKKSVIVLTAVAVLFCVALAGCGGTDDNRNTSTSTETVRATDDNGGNGFMDTTPREEMSTVSEFFSEAANDIVDNDSFLDPQNGMISDTQPGE